MPDTSLALHQMNQTMHVTIILNNIFYLRQLVDSSLSLGSSHHVAVLYPVRKKETASLSLFPFSSMSISSASFSCSLNSPSAGLVSARATLL
mmetsp:Transcript_1370/g.1856  ORF Transcript_1370/g.1856 Transcript_1370/m.1856 type:complete len:92 (-) Transcript_1370:991-1266(-)